ncbi:hypothetical protein PSAC2689_80035 [Paraburkholderia sacchari]
MTVTGLDKRIALVTLSLIGTTTRRILIGARVTWLDWLISGAPWAIVMSAILFVQVLKMLPPETDAIAGGKEAVEKSLRELGPMTGPQKRLLGVSIGLLCFWATEGKLHPFDTTSVTYVGLMLLLLPRFGVMDWKTVQSRIAWGTVIVFGVGISLGTALLTTKAARRDHAARLHRELRLHPADQCAAKHGVPRHRDLHREAVRAGRHRADRGGLSAVAAVCRHVVALARLDLIAPVMARRTR